MVKNIFYKFPENLFKIFSGRNLIWHSLAILLTYVLVVSGFDWSYFKFFNNSTFQTFLFPAVIIGGLLPIILPIAIYIAGRIKNNDATKNVAFAITQAAFLGSLISSFYKFFTGRIQPPLQLINSVDLSHNFQFGFFQHGIFWGWPSSHTTVAFAIAITLIFLYPRNKIVRVSALGLAIYIGIGVSISIHWFSDFLAGAIIGSVIGFVIGKTFNLFNVSPDKKIP